MRLKVHHIFLIGVLLVGVPVGEVCAQDSSGIRKHGPQIQEHMPVQYTPGRLEKSLDETINQELFTLTVVCVILALIPLTILGIVAYKAQQTKTKVPPKSRRGRMASGRNHSLHSVVHTRDLYDISTRGKTGTGGRGARSRNWKYNQQSAGHLAYPVAEMQARRAQNLRENVDPPRSRKRLQWKHKQSPASTL